MKFLEILARWIDRLTEWSGVLVSWLTTVMVLTVFYDTVMRYAFKKGNVAIQELEWHLFSVIFLVGAAYALKNDAHVRVDILFTRFNKKTKAWVDLVGTLVFLIPFAAMVIYSTENFIVNSWAVKEVSPDPGGLPARYVLKAMIPLGFLLLILQGISKAVRNLFVVSGIEMEGGK